VGHFEKHQARYQELYLSLEDEESKTTLRDVLSFRETGDISAMSNYTTRLTEMYFEDFLSIPEESFFYDIGALDGTNTRQFFKRYQRGAGALMVEPLIENGALLFEVQADYSDREVIIENCAISNEGGTANFIIDDRRASSRLSNKKNGREIVVRSLDEIQESGVPIPDLIKMDIEGAELDALTGAEQVIRRSSPALAVSVYHNAHHILDCFEIIQKYNPQYRFYLRHYTEGYAETVLFADYPQ
jgi:FkbM family methyltransferase